MNGLTRIVMVHASSVARADTLMSTGDPFSHLSTTSTMHKMATYRLIDNSFALPLRLWRLHHDELWRSWGCQGMAMGPAA
ncbi:hypothetical protein AB1N83_006056 [Pleurotus pulmonarius]